jgi:hypothetical protein
MQSIRIAAIIALAIIGLALIWAGQDGETVMVILLTIAGIGGYDFLRRQNTNGG